MKERRCRFSKHLKHTSHTKTDIIQEEQLYLFSGQPNHEYCHATCKAW